MDTPKNSIINSTLMYYIFIQNTKDVAIFCTILVLGRKNHYEKIFTNALQYQRIYVIEGFRTFLLQ